MIEVRIKEGKFSYVKKGSIKFEYFDLTGLVGVIEQQDIFGFGNIIKITLDVYDSYNPKEDEKRVIPEELKEYLERDCFLTTYVEKTALEFLNPDYKYLEKEIQKKLEKEKEEEELKKQLESVITALTFSKEKLEKDEREKVTDWIKSKKYFLKNPENYSTCFVWKKTNELEGFIDEFVNFDEYPECQKWKVKEIWNYFNDIEHFISGFISKFEGSAASVDKGRWLLNSYMKYLKDGKMPDMTREEKCYWKPRKGSAEEWMEFIDTYMVNRHRFSMEYLKASAALLKAYTETEENL